MQCYAFTQRGFRCTKPCVVKGFNSRYCEIHKNHVEKMGCGDKALNKLRERCKKRLEEYEDVKSIRPNDLYRMSVQLSTEYPLLLVHKTFKEEYHKMANV